MKRVTSSLLALVLLLALAGTAVAEDKGSITIDNAIVGKTYTIYRIFDLNSHNTDYSAINYTVSEKWTAFFAEGAPGRTYVDIDKTYGYVVWKTGASPANFAAAAIEYAADEATENVDLDDGESYISANGSKWVSVDTVEKSNLCIKAFSDNR